MGSRDFTADELIVLAALTLSDYAKHVLLIAAADRRQGRTHDLWDRATIALAAEIMQGGQSHG